MPYTPTPAYSQGRHKVCANTWQSAPVRELSTSSESLIILNNLQRQVSSPEDPGVPGLRSQSLLAIGTVWLGKNGEHTLWELL